MRSGLALLIAVLLSVACAHAPDVRAYPPPVARQALRADILGCFALFDARGHAVKGNFYGAADTVRLDSAHARGLSSRIDPQRVMLIDPRAVAGTSARPSSTEVGPAWSADSLTDTIRLSFSNGYSGAEFYLNAPRGAGDTLFGRAMEHWGAGPRDVDRGRALAVRVGCVSPAGETPPLARRPAMPPFDTGASRDIS